MSDDIVMRHPTLPAHQEITVPRDAMPHYTSAGWQLVPQAELEERAALAAAAAAEAAKAEEAGAPDGQEHAEPEPAEATAAAADVPESTEPADTPRKRPARSAKAANKDEEN
ncbi:hypothetical protein [Streptomyces sp. NPDC001089]